MRKALVVLLFAALVMAFAGTAAFAADAKFHIGIVTGTVSQSEDDLRGAELMIKKYGDTSKGGMITHLTYLDLHGSCGSRFQGKQGCRFELLLKKRKV